MSSLTDMANRAPPARRARVTSVLTYVVGGLTVVAFLALVLQAGLYEMLAGRPKTPPPEIARPTQITSGPSSISGLDRQSLPYRVMAEEAYQDANVPHHVHLVKPTGTFERPSQQTYDVSANSGIYDTETHILDLEGQVRITAKDRFDATMESAQIAARDKSLVSETPVEVKFGTGSTIAANGLKITDDGNHILFLNGVAAKFRTTGNKGDAQP